MNGPLESSPASLQGNLAKPTSFGVPSPLWSQCRDLSIPRLSQAVTMAISYVMGDLTEQAKQARDMNDFRRLEQAKDTLRHNRDGIVTSFQRRFAQLSTAEPPFSAEPESQGRGLSLMSDSEFHDTSAHDVIAQTIVSVCDTELRGLSRRFRELAKTAQHAGPVNPIDPDLIGQAVLIALRERDVSLTLRGLLAPMLAEHLAATVQTLYQDILDLFSGKGVFAVPAPSRQIAPTDGIGSGGTGASRSTEIVMQQPRGRAVNTALLALTQLQQGKIQLVAAESSGSTEVLHRLASAKFMADIGNSGRIALDMVTAMFDSILDDGRIPTAIRTQLGRLQIPMLKVALLDHAFLKRADHPARQLLQTLTAATQPGQQAITELADRIIDQFVDDLSIFSTEAKDIQQRLESDRQPATQPMAPVASNRHQLEMDKPDTISAQQQIRAQARKANLPKSMLDFLFDHWETIYQAMYGRPVDAELALADPSRAMSTLIRTLEPRNWAENRSGMLALLPAVLKRLKVGMQAANIDESAQNAFLAVLAKCHAAAMQAAKQLASSSTDIPTLAPASDQIDSPPPMPTPSVEPSTRPASSPKNATDKHDALIRSLQRGTLIEFHEQGGSMAWLKLAWISPNGSIFVFTNKHGERALTINATALAERFRREEARVAMDLTVRSHSPNYLAGRLQNAA